MNHPFERIHGPMTRKQLLRRAAVGGATLSLPGILAACGGDGGIEGQQAPTGAGDTTVAQELADEITVSNWPFYIDQNDEATKFPTLEQFTKETGVKVNYLEDINSNEEFFGEIQAPLSRGQGIDRDIIVPTAWLAARLLDLGYLQKLDKSAIPNIDNLEDTLASPAWDPNRDYSLPWQSYITGIGYDPKKVGGELTSVEQLLDPAHKGCHLYTTPSPPDKLISRIPSSALKVGGGGGGGGGGG
ncbi:MAG: ABC transporter substrate-binding protein, partial [Gaiellaceae bacterium]